jgi:hypothetical protein
VSGREDIFTTCIRRMSVATILVLRAASGAAAVGRVGTWVRGLVGLLLGSCVATLVFACAVSAAVPHWSVQAAPRLEKGDTLFGVSCTSSSTCVAVGGPDFDNSSAKRGRLFAELWNGRAWSLEVLPTPNVGNSELAAVSCLSPTSCTAVGHSGQNVLVETWNGRIWSIQQAPSPKEGQSKLLGVSCPSVTDCFAAGNWAVNNMNGYFTYPLVERWNGSRWSIQPTAEPYGTTNTVGFTAVSCSSPMDCTAVGSENAANYKADFAVERWNGHYWYVQAPQLYFYFIGQSDDLNGVSCPSRKTCAAVGSVFADFGSGDVESYQVSEFWNGRAWGAPDLEPKATGLGDELDGVSCVSDRACLAVGSNVEHWDGSRWSVVRTTFAVPDNWLLHSVSCTLRTTCEAVGFVWTGVNSTEYPLAVRWTS